MTHRGETGSESTRTARSLAKRDWSWAWRALRLARRVYLEEMTNDTRRAMHDAAEACRVVGRMWQRERRQS